MKTESICVWLVALALLGIATSSVAYEGIHGGRHGRPTVNYDSLFEAATPLDQSPKGQKYIERCLTAYGGRKHLAVLKTIGLHYRMISTLSGDSSDFDKSVAPNRRLNTSRQGTGHEKVRYLDGDNAWRGVGGEMEKLEGSGYCATLFSYLTLMMPLAMETEPFSEIRVGTRESDSLDYIYMKKNDSLMIVIGLDSSGFFIRSSEGIIFTGEKYQVYINLFDDHRKVDGYLLPHRLTYISQGLKVGYSELGAVEINPPFSDDQFRPRQTAEDSF